MRTSAGVPSTNGRIIILATMPVKVDEGDWRSFEQWQDDLKSACRKAKLLFRGQGSSDWKLETTLERHGKRSMLVWEYYQLIIAVGPAIETLTGVRATKHDLEIQKSFNSVESFFEVNRFPSGLDYEYLVYLRHHGFPSPLLDWTRSPYVAAFFAFRNESAGSEKRSIYAYCETPTGAKGGAVGEPTIRTLGPYVRSHPRHFRQQSEYTLCESLDVHNRWQYDSHQHVVEEGRPGQDWFWKFDLSVEERVDVLQRLDSYNLNAYSLFDSQETLLETLWLREHVFRPKR
jgi:hypothetical protein